MRLLNQKVLVDQHNISRIEIGSVIEHNSAIYDVFDIEGVQWPHLIISAVARTGSPASRLRYFNPAKDTLKLKIPGLVNSIHSRILQSLIF